MYLHKDKNAFRDLIEMVSKDTGRAPDIIEKDYYVTMILKLLSEELGQCVFKGGTSLSKGYHVIDRFSEDIDITFAEHIGASRRKKLKNVTLKGISEKLEMPITNWSETQSDRDYNAYLFAYDSIVGVENDRLLQHVKLETALGSYAFPTQTVMLDNYIGDYLKKQGRKNFVEQYGLDEFTMNLQTLERTYIDKIFALCDYYMNNRSQRCSRHLYDIYKLTPIIDINKEFRNLIKEVRLHRSQMSICPSAKPDINISALILEFCNNEFYKEDYCMITNYFADDIIPYGATIDQMRAIASSGLFTE